MKDYDDAVLRYEGVLEGAQKKAREMATRMLSKNEPVDKNVEYTDSLNQKFMKSRQSLSKNNENNGTYSRGEGSAFSFCCYSL